MKSPQSASLPAYGALALTMLFWAGNAIVGRAVRDDIPPFTLALGRWTIALLILAPFAVGRLAADRQALRGHWRTILFLGLVGVAAFNGFLYSGLRYTTAGNSLLLQALIPGLVLLMGRIAFGDRAPAAQLVGVLLSTLGVVTIVFRGDPAAMRALTLGRGDALILCGCVAWAVYTACLRTARTLDPIAFMFLTFCVGAAAMAPLAWQELARAPLVWRWEVIGAFAYVGIFPSIIAFFLYNRAVGRLGAGPAGQTISLMPIFGALLAAQLLGEPLHRYHAAGMALILGGIALAWRAARRGNAASNAAGKAAAPPRRSDQAGASISSTTSNS